MSACSSHRLEAWVLDELGADDSADLQLHVRRCAGCADEAARLRAVRAAFRERAAGFDPLLLAIRARVEAELEGRRPTRALLRRERPLIGALSMAALLLGVGVALHAPERSQGQYSAAPVLSHELTEDEDEGDPIARAIARTELEFGACLMGTPVSPPLQANACL